jgi:hypothetical protein
LELDVVGMRVNCEDSWGGDAAVHCILAW